MADVTIIQVCDAIVTVLNAASLSQSFTAVRSYSPEYDLKDMTPLHVTVVPKSEKDERLSRNAAMTMKVFEVDIAVQKRVPAKSNSEIDPLVLLVQEIVDLLDGYELITRGICTTTRPNPIFAPEHLDEMRQFTSIIECQVKVLPS